ncbi:protein translocase subunit SecD [Demequina oxidasica]|uniref:protein translocase subunit SecD n=1 Tax=Demequina oxidasica TaxID=676199 RepID=UPI0007837FEF|nr:protein translocase subunit SecD [Demequina oxidasica]
MSTVKKSARKSLIWLGALTAVLYTVLAIGVGTGSTTWAPGLGLDLAGGRQLILTPEVDNGVEITQTDLDQAVEIMRNRVDASGVAEAEISTQYPNIVVSLPGNPDQATIDLVRQSAQLQFRAVLVEGAATPTATQPVASPSASADPAEAVAPSASAEPTPSPSASQASQSLFQAAATPAPEASDESAPVPSLISAPVPSADASAVPTDTTVPFTEPVPGETDPSSFDWITPELSVEYAQLDCFDPVNISGRDLGEADYGHVACGSTTPAKYIMGPVEMTGTDLSDASSGPHYTTAGTLDGTYQVNMEFTSEGGAKFAEITGRIAQLEAPRNQFAIMLDGAVLSAPRVQQSITGGSAQITGNFTQEEAAQLANQLKFGALPLTFTVQSDEQISATLGAEQLQSGLIAGAIGLVLVVIYSLIQYRALGLVTVGSLVIAGLISFAVISLLSWGIGYRLSLAGVAGLIVAIGITADSFIVYFERVRDELREGRSLHSAIDHAWKRARRTILASDAVSLLAAVVLYTFAVGGVRGFAFTLGLTTLVDILVVFLFTHPILVLLGRTKFFGDGHPMSGFDPKQLGRETMYKGRGRVASPSTKVISGSADPDGAQLTLAERKAAAAKAAQPAQAEGADNGAGGATDPATAPAEGEK